MLGLRAIGAVAEARTRWLAELQVDGQLPERTVIVPNEATAHAWRREIVDAHPELLIGTRFITPIAVALEVLESCGVPHATGEEAVRAARIVGLLEREIALEWFEVAVLRTGRGWADALASTITELERALIGVETLEASPDPRCRDVARLMRELDLLAGSSWTMARVLREATARVVADPSAWPYGGACLVEVNGHEDMAMAAWLRAIPGVRIVSIATQPRRTAYVERVRARFGDLALQELETFATKELGLLARYLFSAPDVLGAPDRPRSDGIDETVHLEEHAGLEEELDAVVSWVIGEIADVGTPLEQIGIVVPQLDPYAALLAARLEVLVPDGVCVLGGVPATATSAGARIAMLLRALAGHLHLDVLAELLPVVQLGSEDVWLSRADAIAALYELGTIGGSAARPEGALEWLTRIPVRTAALASAVEAASKDEDNAHEVRRMGRTLAHLRALAEPLEAVVAAARIVLDRGDLAELWKAIRTVVERHLRTGFEGERIAAVIATALEPLMATGLASGQAALAAIANALDAVRLPVGRFGQPRMTIAALTDVGGLTFRTVRVLGLAEGAVPAGVREDPVLPDSVRRTLGAAMPLAADRPVEQLHALHRVVLGSTERIVLSVARMDPERRYREPSGVLLEAAAALGRPPLGSGGAVIPDSTILREEAFEPARAALRSLRSRWPVQTTGQLDRAVRRREVPRAWMKDRLVGLDRLLVPVPATPGPMDGWFEGAFAELPGLSAERPVSASALSRLLECPHRFLFERVLHWTPPPELADEGSIDALSYGTLFHAVAETFYLEHGAAFCRREKQLAEWRAIGESLADAAFATFLETYPLVGELVRDSARRRLRRDLRTLLAADWREAKTFVAVERPFGPFPLALDDSRTIHVRGYIDRLDRTPAATLVRDLKTGKAKRRKDAADLRPAYDVQLGLYGLVVQAHATTWELPPKVEGAYVYPSDSDSGDERSFRADFDDLTTHTRSWLGTAIDLLSGRRFPRTPASADCTFCPFKPVCGTAAQDRAQRLLAEPDEAVARFAKLKSEDGDEA